MKSSSDGNGSLPRRVQAFRLWTSVSLAGGEHCHDHHELIIPTRGSYRARVAGDDMMARPGTMVGYPARTAHDPQLPRRRGNEFIVVQWWGGLSPWLGLRRDHEHRGRMLAEWLIDAVAAEHTQVSRLLVALITHLDEAEAAPVEDHGGIIQRLCDDMRSKLEAPLSLHELALNVGWTPQHLIRRFRQATGQSPMAWFQRQRLDRARLLLANGDDVEVVARRCGYMHGRNLLRALHRNGW